MYLHLPKVDIMLNKWNHQLHTRAGIQVCYYIIIDFTWHIIIPQTIFIILFLYVVNTHKFRSVNSYRKKISFQLIHIESVYPAKNEGCIQLVSLVPVICSRVTFTKHQTTLTTFKQRKFLADSSVPWPDNLLFYTSYTKNCLKS